MDQDSEEMKNQSHSSEGGNLLGEQGMRNLGRIVVSILFFGTPIGIVCGFKFFVLKPIMQDLERQQYTVATVLEEVPKVPAFYVFFAAIMGVFAGWRWWMFSKHRDNFKEQARADDKSSLTTPRLGRRRGASGTCARPSCAG